MEYLTVGDSFTHKSVTYTLYDAYIINNTDLYGPSPGHQIVRLTWVIKNNRRNDDFFLDEIDISPIDYNSVRSISGGIEHAISIKLPPKSVGIEEESYEVPDDWNELIIQVRKGLNLNPFVCFKIKPNKCRHLNSINFGSLRFGK